MNTSCSQCHKKLPKSKIVEIKYHPTQKKFCDLGCRVKYQTGKKRPADIALKIGLGVRKTLKYKQSLSVDRV